MYSVSYMCWDDGVLLLCIAVAFLHSLHGVDACDDSKMWAAELALVLFSHNW